MKRSRRKLKTFEILQERIPLLPSGLIFDRESARRLVWQASRCRIGFLPEFESSESPTPYKGLRDMATAAFLIRDIWLKDEVAKVTIEPTNTDAGRLFWSKRDDAIIIPLLYADVVDGTTKVVPETIELVCLDAFVPDSSK